MTDHKRKRAVALRYDPGRDSAPVVLAKGEGHRADLIRELAAASGVVVRQDPALVEAFSLLEPETEIPPELYSVVAELLAIIYRMHARSEVGRDDGLRREIPDRGDP